MSRFDVIVSRIVRAAGEKPLVCFVNPSDHFQTLKAGKLVGMAHETFEIVDVPLDSKAIPLNPLATINIESSKLNVVNTSLSDREINNTTGLPTLPEHLKEVFQISKEKLTDCQSNKLSKLLIEYADVFAESEYDLGNFTSIEHTIDTGDAKPIKQRMRRTPTCFVHEEEGHLQKMMDAGVIQESMSEWASAPVLIRKRDGSVRWCIDYRALNNVTIKDTFPLPLVEDCLDTLSGNIWFSKLDANSAYWQVKISESDRKKTAFVTKYGLFEHVRMGFGLTNAPAT